MHLYKFQLTYRQIVDIIKRMIYRRFLIIIMMFILIIAFGTVGYQVIEGWSFLEAIYMTIITISTVGFREVSMLSHAGMIFTMILILTGIAVITMGGSFIFTTIMGGTFTESMRRQRMEKTLSRIKNHFIICGSGVVGEDVIKEFIRAKAPFVVVDKEKEVTESLIRQFPRIVYLIGNATDDAVLKTARIEHAKGIIAVLGSDADNLYICLTARSINPKLRIIARAIEGEAINKLKKAGADYVFSPEKIGGLSLAAAALKPSVTSFLDVILQSEYLNIILDEIEVNKDSPIVGRTLKDAEITKNIGIIILAIKSAHKDRLTFNPSFDTVINPRDMFVTFGTPDQISRLKKLCKSSFKIA